MNNQLFNRNIGILKQSDQETIKSKNILIAGCGLGSVIASLAVRTGFINLKIADGDVVEETNLNRQAFNQNDIGKKKVLATECLLNKINPNINLISNPSNITFDDIEPILDNCDLVIDTIDLSAIKIILELHKKAREKTIPVIFPLNLGWTSGAMVFNDISPSLNELLKLNKESDLELNNLLPRWTNLMLKYIKDPVQLNLLNDFLRNVKRDGWCPAPQLGITSFSTASLVISLAVKISLGLEVKDSPSAYLIDIFNAHTQN